MVPPPPPISKLLRGPCSCIPLHLFRLPYSDWAFLASPGLGGGGWRQTPPLRVLFTIKDIDMKLTPLIKRRQINQLLLSYLSCDVT